MPTIWIAVLVLTTAAPPQEEPVSPEVSPVVQPSGPAISQGESDNPAERADQAGTQVVKLQKRTGRELLRAVRETLARLARPEDEQLEACVEELLFVRQELQEDDAMAGSQREYYTVKVESRLQQLSIQLKKRISRNKRLAKSKPPARIRGPEEKPEVLGQRVAGAVPPGPQRVGNGGPAGGRGRQQPNDDYGQHLVDLIQKTVAPSTWDVNGGLGTIYYWRPGRALVVRQTGEVHDNMGGVLDQLRRAGP